MSIRKLPNGRWEARERAGGRGSRRLSKTFDRKGDAERWEARMRRQRQLGAPLEEDDVTLAEFVEEYWRLHAMPNLAPSTRASYMNIWGVHVHDRLGERELRTITPKVLTRFRADLERAGVGAATVRKALALVQSILSFAVVEERVGVQRRRDGAQAALRTRKGAARLPAARRRGAPRANDPPRRDACLAARVQRPAAGGGAACRVSRGAMSARRRCTSTTPSATGSAGRQCSRRSPRTCASGGLRADAPRPGRQ